MFYHQAKSFLCAAATALVLTFHLAASNVAQTLPNSSALQPSPTNVSVQLKATLGGHTKSIIAVAFSQDGETLATGSQDGTVRLWDVGRSELKATLGGADKYEWVQLVWSPDGRSLAVYDTRKLQVWDADKRELKFTLGAEHEKILGLVWSPDGQTLLTTGYKGTAKLWNALTGSLQATFLQDPPCPKRSALETILAITLCADDFHWVQGYFDAASRSVLTTSLNYPPKHWDAVTGKLRNTSLLTKTPLDNGPDNYAMDYLFSPDKRLAVKGKFDEVISIHDATTGELKMTLGKIGHPLAFSPDGHLLLVNEKRPLKWTHNHDALSLWEVATGEKRVTFENQPDGIHDIYWNPDGGSLVAVGGSGSRAQLIDVHTGRVIAKLLYGGCASDSLWGNGCDPIIFSADGRLMLKQTKTLNLLSGKSGELLATLDQAQPPAAFSPVNGQLLVTIGKDKKSALLWEIDAK
jgi:WD40 repeat protein